MLFDSYFTQADEANQEHIARLENFHLRNYSPVLWLLLIAMVSFVVWANSFRIDQVARASGEVIASSRVQIIQAVDGGVLADLNVREGDRVIAGQVLATLDQTRFSASVNEVLARLNALRAKAQRLRAEVTNKSDLVFSEQVRAYPALVELEAALFQQRRTGLAEEVRTLEVLVRLADEERQLMAELAGSGDVNRSEVIRVERTLNDAQANLINRKNKYLEDARVELSRAEDEIAQNVQILAQRQEQLDNSVLVALVPGIVKNVAVTTIGGVLRPGEELMQIIPIDDDLIIEAKISPSEIADVHVGLEATVRFDPFDYTIFGGVTGKVIYVSADTLKEETNRGIETYYRVQVATISTNPVVTTIGRELEILPGMTAQVDIRTADRTLIDYLLKPLRKTLAESMGEG